MGGVDDDGGEENDGLMTPKLSISFTVLDLDDINVINWISVCRVFTNVVVSCLCLE